MAHKTLINGTSYDIKGGRTLVNGTGYDIKKGRTLVGGTGYDIGFGIPPAIQVVWQSSWRGFDSIDCIHYANGCWVVGGHCYGSGSNECIFRIAYAQSLTGPWTIKDLSDIWGSEARVNCIYYANGYWVVGGIDFGRAAVIYYSTNLNDWQKKIMWTPRQGSAESVGVFSICYANSTWVFGGGHIYEDEFGTMSQAEIAWCTNLDSALQYISAWQSRGSGDLIKKIFYTGSRFIFVGTRFRGSNTHAAFAYSTNLSTIGVPIETEFISLADACYENNTLFLTGGKSSYSGDGRFVGYVLNANEGGTTINYQEICPPESSSSISGYPSITYGGGKYAVCGPEAGNKIVVRYTNSPFLAQNWTPKYLTLFNPFKFLTSIYYANGIWVVGGKSSTSDSNVYIVYASSIEELGKNT